MTPEEPESNRRLEEDLALIKLVKSFTGTPGLTPDEESLVKSIEQTHEKLGPHVAASKVRAWATLAKKPDEGHRR